MKADTQISGSGVPYVPVTDTGGMEVRGNLRPLSDTQELFLNFSRRLDAVSEWSFLFGLDRHRRSFIV
jgi:hypothetical protein